MSPVRTKAKCADLIERGYLGTGVHIEALKEYDSRFGRAGCVQKGGVCLGEVQEFSALTQPLIESKMGKKKKKNPSRKS